MPVWREGGRSADCSRRPRGSALPPSTTAAGLDPLQALLPLGLPEASAVLKAKGLGKATLLGMAGAAPPDLVSPDGPGGPGVSLLWCPDCEVRLEMESKEQPAWWQLPCPQAVGPLCALPGQDHSPSPKGLEASGQ